MNFDNLKQTDPLCYDFIVRETKRQEECLEMIPSECIASLSVIEALWSPFTNKYSEGYAKKRYYAWNEIVDEVELLAIERAKKAYPWIVHANVQPYSGSPANFAVFNALMEPGDTMLGLALSQWGHLTHWHKVSTSAKYFNAVQFGLKPDGYIDLEEVETLAVEHKPKVIVVGFTAYAREFPFAEFARIAEKVGAYLLADISHISGLVVSGAHTSPAPYADVIMTTTHKTLKGPRGAMIMTTEKWIKKDPDLAKKLDKSVFPGIQGWPHNHQTLAIAVALGEALTPEFKELWHQTVKNAKMLAHELQSHGFELAAGWTDTHLLLASVGKGRGWFMSEALDHAGMALNKNTVPNEPCSPFNPSGIRMWTPIMTMRGMKESEMKIVAGWMKEVFDEISEFTYKETKEERREELKKFRKFIKDNQNIKRIREEVKQLCLKFPIYS